MSEINKTLDKLNSYMLLNTEQIISLYNELKVTNLELSIFFAAKLFKTQQIYEITEDVQQIYKTIIVRQPATKKSILFLSVYFSDFTFAIAQINQYSYLKKDADFVAVSALKSRQPFIILQSLVTTAFSHKFSAMIENTIYKMFIKQALKNNILFTKYTNQIFSVIRMLEHDDDFMLLNSLIQIANNEIQPKFISYEAFIVAINNGNIQQIVEILSLRNLSSQEKKLITQLKKPDLLQISKYIQNDIFICSQIKQFFGYKVFLIAQKLRYENILTSEDKQFLEDNKQNELVVCLNAKYQILDNFEIQNFVNFELKNQIMIIGSLLEHDKLDYIENLLELIKK